MLYVPLIKYHILNHAANFSAKLTACPILKTIADNC